jgi:hypothetical protein
MLNVNDTHVFVLENYLTAASQTNSRGKKQSKKESGVSSVVIIAVKRR